MARTALVSLGTAPVSFDVIYCNSLPIAFAKGDLR